MSNRRTQHSLFFRGLCVSAVIPTILALAAAGTLAGCRPTHTATATAAAPFSPEGRWRSSKLGVMTVHVQPGGALLILDPHGGKHPFPRVGSDRWQARISREVQATIDREGDQLVFRTQPTPEAAKPIAQKNGLTIVHSAKPIEDHMTRLPDAGPGSKGSK